MRNDRSCSQYVLAVLRCGVRREQPPFSFGNPLMAYVPGGGMVGTADDVKPAPVKRAVKKGKAGGSCCC